jgi:MFS family permease
MAEQSSAAIAQSQELAASAALRITALLALAMFINYVDRANLATAGPLLKSELHLSATQFGLLSSAFFWTYAGGQPVMGWVSERVGARWMMVFGLGLWSLATIATGLVQTFAVLFVLRLVLGLGEGVVFPASSQLLAGITKAGGRGRSNGATIVGMSIGPAFGTLVGGLLMASVGWRAIFVVFGAISLVWIAPWLIATRSVDQIEPRSAMASQRPSLRQLLSQRSLWGAAAGHFSYAYALYVVLSWLPIYLVRQLGFSLSGMATLGSSVYLLQACGAAAIGFVLDGRVAAGWPVSLAYKAAMAVCTIGLALAFVLSATSNVSVSVLAMLSAGFFLGLGCPVIFAIVQTFAGPSASAQWVGIQNALANLAGLSAPVITGVIFDRTGSFSGAFLFGGIVLVVGAAAWVFAVGRVSPVKWTQAAA